MSAQASTKHTALAAGPLRAPTQAASASPGPAFPGAWHPSDRRTAPARRSRAAADGGLGRSPVVVAACELCDTAVVSVDVGRWALVRLDEPTEDRDARLPTVRHLHDVRAAMQAHQHEGHRR